MKNELIGLLLMGALFFGGCSALGKAVNTIAPNQTEVVSTTDPITGVITNTVVEVPGSHIALPITNSAAGAIPYGPIALAGLLLIVNFYERYRSNKVGKGLQSTIQAIELAGKDPATAAAIAELKVKLSQAHQYAGVQPLINDILAKLKLLPPTA